MSDVIFAEGNESAADPKKAAILDKLNGPLKNIIDSTTDIHQDQARFDRTVKAATDLAIQWQVHVGGIVAANNVPDDKISTLFTLANNIYDDASQDKQTQYDAQRAADLVATLEAMQSDDTRSIYPSHH